MDAVLIMLAIVFAFLYADDNEVRVALEMLMNEFDWMFEFGNIPRDGMKRELH